MGLISVVIPVYNEEKNVLSLYFEVKKVLKSLKTPFEVIFVNDGSTDNTLKELRSISNITIINLNKNYGQAVALDAGFKAATGELVVSLDGDGQNDPADIPKLIKKLQHKNLDVVAGWRKKRKDSRWVRFVSHIARLLRRFFINDPIHDSGCTLRVYKKRAVKSLDIGGDMHRYILALLRWKGFKIDEAIVSHRPRRYGKSKYGMFKMVRGFIDLVYVWFIHKYSQRPLHLFGYASILAFTFGGMAAAWSIYAKIVLGTSLNRNGWFFLAFFFLLAGIIFFSFGMVLHLLIKIHLNNSPNEKRYYIKEIIKTSGKQTK